MPPDTVVRQASDDPVSLLTSRLEERAELGVCPDEVCSAVTIDHSAQSSSGNKAAEGGEKGVGGIVAHDLEMNGP